MRQKSDKYSRFVNLDGSWRGNIIYSECERKRELKISTLGNGQMTQSYLKWLNPDSLLLLYDFDRPRQIELFKES